MLGVFMGYSRGIHGVFICIGYVSVMYRLCIGNVTEEKSSEGVNKEDNENYKHPMARAPRNPNYLNHKRGYLSTMKTIRFNNGDN